MRLVLDTDVLVSGLRSAIGASRVLLQAVEQGVVIPLMSVATVIEYEAVLQRPENLAAAGLTADDVADFLDGLVALSEPVVPHVAYRGRIRDPDDAMFVEVAINGGADAIVSFNVGDFVAVDPLDTGFGVALCRPGEMVRRLAWRPSATSRFGFLRH